jgi:hypothetical protein
MLVWLGGLIWLHSAARLISLERLSQNLIPASQLRDEKAPWSVIIPMPTAQLLVKGANRTRDSTWRTGPSLFGATILSWLDIAAAGATRELFSRLLFWLQFAVLSNRVSDRDSGPPAHWRYPCAVSA